MPLLCVCVSDGNGNFWESAEFIDWKKISILKNKLKKIGRTGLCEKMKKWVLKRKIKKKNIFFSKFFNFQKKSKVQFSTFFRFKTHKKHEKIWKFKSKSHKKAWYPWHLIFSKKNASALFWTFQEFARAHLLCHSKIRWEKRKKKKKALNRNEKREITLQKKIIFFS